MMNQQKTKRYISMIVVSVYLFLSLFSILMLSDHMHEAGLPTQDCPYSQGIYSICTMDVSGHIQAWQNMTKGFVSLLAFLPVIFLLIHIVPHSMFLGLGNRKRKKENYPNPYQKLFSRGILHPKVF